MWRRGNFHFQSMRLAYTLAYVTFIGADIIQQWSNSTAGVFNETYANFTQKSANNSAELGKNSSKPNGYSIFDLYFVNPSAMDEKPRANSTFPLNDDSTTIKNDSNIWATWLNNTMALVDSAFKLPDRNGSKSSDSIFDLLFITPIQANNRSQEWSNETMVNISNLLPVNLTSFNNLTANFIKDVNKTEWTWPRDPFTINVFDSADLKQTTAIATTSATVATKTLTTTSKPARKP